MRILLFLVLLPFTALSQSQRNYGLKSIPKPFLKEGRYSLISQSIDWRNVRGINWVGPVKNQANCGSCVAFASLATVEDQFTIHSGQFWNRISLSQEALFSCGGGNCYQGWTTIEAAHYLKKHGAVDLSCAPYTAGQLGKTRMCTNFCQSQTKRTVEISNFYRPTVLGFGTQADVKKALLKGPLMSTMAVYPGFDSYKGGIFKADPDATSLGGHAVEVVGFNDEERYWIIKNSWGEDWGERGFARVSYDDTSGIGNDTYGFDFSSKFKEAFLYPLEDQYIRGNLKIEGKFSKKVSLRKINGDLVEELTCKNKCELKVGNLQDGPYYLETEAGIGKLITRGLVIANSDYTWKSKVSSSKKGPQSGKVFIDVNFEKSEVYPERIIAEVVNSKGKLAYRRVYSDVLGENRLAFNSYMVPDGVYTIHISEEFFGKTKTIGKVRARLENN